MLAGMASSPEEPGAITGCTEETGDGGWTEETGDGG
jgi:hypothetical protein